MRTGMALVLAAGCALAWGQDDENQISAYTNLSVNWADRIAGGLDGTIERMEGNVDIVLTSDDPDRKPLPIKADLITFEYPEGGGGSPSRIVLEGNVHVEHPAGTFRGEHADWDFEAGRLVFTGDPVMDTAQFKNVRAETFILDFKTNRFEILKGRADAIPLQAAPRAIDPSLLRERDIEDWAGFLAAFKKQCVGDAPSPAKHILGLFQPEAKRLVSSLPAEDLVQYKDDFLKRMNEALEHPSFYDAASWQGAVVPPEAADLMQAAGGLEPEQQARLNRLMLEAAYPKFVRAAVTKEGP